MRSGSVSNACDQSTDARSVCCRRTAVRAPPVNSRKRSCRLPTISSSDSARTRAAASSIASGMPSSRRQISVTVAALSSVTVKSGRTRRARSANNSIASSASDSDGTATSPRPARRSAHGSSRAAVNPGQAASSSATSDALASSRCSQLSSTISIWRSPTNRDAASPSSSGPAGRAVRARGPPRPAPRQRV